TSAFALGDHLAGLGGTLAAPRRPATRVRALEVIASAFIVVDVGGLGSIPGAFLAALLISEAKALCIFLGEVSVAGHAIDLPRLTLVAEFAVMAVVLVVRPCGLMGRQPEPGTCAAERGAPVAPA